MTVSLSATTTQIIVPQQTKSFSALTISRMVDLPGVPCVKIFTQELPNPIILWSGETAYNAIGNWTDSDVQTAIQSLF